MPFGISFEPWKVIEGANPSKPTIRGIKGIGSSLVQGTKASEPPSAMIEAIGKVSGEPVAGETISVEAILFEFLMEYSPSASYPTEKFFTYVKKALEELAAAVTRLTAVKEETAKQIVALEARKTKLSEQITQLTSKLTALAEVKAQAKQWSEVPGIPAQELHQAFMAFNAAIAEESQTKAEQKSIEAEREEAEKEIHALKGEEKRIEREQNQIKEEERRLEFERATYGRQQLDEMSAQANIQAVLVLDKVGGQVVAVIALEPTQRNVTGYAEAREIVSEKRLEKNNTYQNTYAGRVELINSPDILPNEQVRARIYITGGSIFPPTEALQSTVPTAFNNEVFFASAEFKLQASANKSLARTT